MSVAGIGIRNGRPMPLARMTLPVQAPAVRLGFGVFETVGVRRGRAFLLGDHSVRLTEGIRRLDPAWPWTAGTAFRWGAAAVQAAGVREGVLRFVAVAPVAGPSLSPVGAPTLDAWVESLEPGERHARGLRVVTRAAPRTAASPLAGTKSICWADHALLRRQAREAGADDALLVATSGDGAGSGSGHSSGTGDALETTSANVFAVSRDGLLRTPSVDQGVLPGITRGLVLRLAPGLSLHVVVSRLPLEDLLESAEAFVTSALIGIRPLVALDGRPIGTGRPGPVTERVERAWRSLAE